MNDYEIVLKPARTSLILFVLSVLFALALVSGLSYLRVKEEQSNKKTERMLSDAREHIVKLTTDLDSIRQLKEKYNRLSRSGFIGEPDRDSWVQQLESIYRDTRLPPSLRYTLSPPQLINQVQDSSADSYLNHIFHHDLKFELSAIHEGEFLSFMEQLRANWRAPYRVDTCQFIREDASQPVAGLKINCTVQLYSLPDKAVVNR
jgi:hypothetical protein